jgi:hypothetical protein
MELLASLSRRVREGGKEKGKEDHHTITTKRFYGQGLYHV